MSEETHSQPSGGELSAGEKPAVAEPALPAQKIPAPEWDQSPYEATVRLGMNMFFSVIICWLSVGIAVEIGFVAIMLVDGAGSWSSYFHEIDLTSVLTWLFWGPIWYALNGLFANVVSFLCCIAGGILFISAISLTSWKGLLCRCFLLMLTVWMSLFFTWLNTPINY